MDSILRKNLMLSAGAVATSYAFVSPRFAVSLAVGAALEAMNFRGLRATASVILASPVEPPRRFGASGFGARFMLLALGVGVALYVGAHPVGLVIGLSLIIPAAVIEAWRTRPPIDEAAPGLEPDDEGWDLWNPWLAIERDPEDAEDDEGDDPA